MQLGGTLELAPSLLETTAGHVASAVSNGAGAAVGGGTTARVLAAEAEAAGVVAMHHVTGATAADMVDGGGAAEVALEFLVEAEDGALAGAVNIAGATAAGGESNWRARVEASERGRANGRARVGGSGVLEANDIALTSATCVHCRTGSVRHGRVRLNNAVI